ncbi:hypothetical protein [Chryseobacterium echinoideorum]|uniref:hypothetical protein n=1 Tax=Chryseobacterium echinoideorum TaxID=1549648 RepID=UPI001185D7B6|nr:hypothetical protein [Chryseobacterium echinoideorum]
MLQTETKKAIKVISEKYFHQVSFDYDVLKIFNDINLISINHIKKNEFKIKYNCEDYYDSIVIEEPEVFDVLINIFEREKLEKVSKSKMELITIEILLEEEVIHSAKDIKNFFEFYNGINQDYLNVGGNRVLQEYYKGYLILRDDFKYNYKSNVIKINNIA